MLFDKKETLKKLNNQSILLGYDLGEHNSQISFCSLAEAEPQTLSVVAGSEQFNIPTVLCKSFEVDQWFFGKEALKKVEEKEGILVEGLIEKARSGEPVLLEEKEFDPIELLTLFIKRSFSILTLIANPANIAAAMVTVEHLDPCMIEILKQVVRGLALPEERAFFQSYEESAYQYVVKQPKELWNYGAAVCDFTGQYLKTYRMSLNKNTIPIVALLENHEYTQMREENDDAFLEIAHQLCQDHHLGSVFLIGDRFQGEWGKKSLSYLCSNRRVFQGNNLYSKGACYAVFEKLMPTEEGKQYVYLGKDKLKANIGMKVMKNGEEAYQVLLNAGETWYDSGKELDFMLEAGNLVSIIISSIQERGSKIAEIALSGLPMRPKKTTRIHMEMTLLSEDNLQVSFADMGFGELFKSSEMVWTEEVPLS